MLFTMNHITGVAKIANRTFRTTIQNLNFRFVFIHFTTPQPFSSTSIVPSKGHASKEPKEYFELGLGAYLIHWIIILLFILEPYVR